jgi:hypothetical protein
MTHSSRRATARVNPRIQARSERLIRTLVAGGGSPAKVLELCYWSREPGMIEIMRGIAAMREESRAALEAFIALARNPKSIAASLDPDGTLTLVSPEVPKSIALARYVSENGGDEPLQKLN